MYLLRPLLFSNSKVMFLRSVRVPTQTYSLAFFQTEARVRTVVCTCQRKATSTFLCNDVP